MRSSAAQLVYGRVRYAIIVHRQTGRAYSLDSGYALLEELVDPDVVRSVKREHYAEWIGWTPTAMAQKPWWQLWEDLLDCEFTAYWTCDAVEAARMYARAHP